MNAAMQVVAVRRDDDLMSPQKQATSLFAGIDEN